MTCELTGYVYNKACVHCMVRKIKNLRSTTAPRFAKQKQLETFEWMGAHMAGLVKEELRNELQTG
ncbi:hypothetical protein [Pusillimonas noertemannii]|uniref:Uncharacterized protein n=1 Tax=Pusillimonas noertemannii TaxID=305977 RepID=A0A2U1CMI1_9BURK|nr:hypothetical protein [Pusillimonas noertemannii]NYT68783.1 hypothetical protein [Pusillimonas noertemannii]PVY62194.1 hypothetical protein C7440_1687 [Pusillimonas noertemannii]TFL10820.1 hypothetical protein CSC72_09920 [Pusillimonas noertemannii]